MSSREKVLKAWLDLLELITEVFKTFHDYVVPCYNFRTTATTSNSLHLVHKFSKLFLISSYKVLTTTVLMLWPYVCIGARNGIVTNETYIDLLILKQ